MITSLVCLSSCNGMGTYYQDTTFIQVVGINDGVNTITGDILTPFNTTIGITRYSTSRKFKDIERDVNRLIAVLHANFDSHYEYTIDGQKINNLKTINDHYGDGEFLEVSDELYELLSISIEMTKLSKGKFNVGIGSLTDLWSDYIEANKSAKEIIKEKYFTMYPDCSVIETIALPQDIQKEGISNIDVIKYQDDIIYIYQLNAISEEENISFYLGIKDNIVDAYMFNSSSNTASTGSKYFMDNDKINKLIKGYDGSQNIIVDEVEITSRAVKNSIDFALSYFDIAKGDALIGMTPSTQEIDEALSCVPDYENIDKIIELKEPNLVRINKLDSAQGQVRLSLGAIAKGYAVDKLKELLKDQLGYISGGGSSIVTFSDNPWGEWKFSLSNPVYREKYALQDPSYKNYNQAELRFYKQGIFAFSTSGDYENFYYGFDNHRYHHIIDPETGYPSTYFRATSAVCNDSAYADAITTALMNMDLDEGREFIKNMENYLDTSINALWMKENDNKINTFADSRIKDYLTLNRGQESNEYITTLDFIEI